MGTALLKLWEALGGSLGLLILGLIVLAMFWAWRREVQRAENDRKAFWAAMKEEREAREKQAERDRAEAKERDDRDRAEAKERDDRDREAFEARADRIHTESKERDERDRAAHEERANRDSEQNAHDHARLFSAIAAVQGDVKVLLDRSNRSSGGEPGGQPRPFGGVAHQATPDQCDEDGETSSDEQVAPAPSASGSKDPAD